MSPAPALPRLLWIVDRAGLESATAMGAVEGGLRFLYLRDPAIDRSAWRAWCARNAVPDDLTVVAAGGPPWALDAGYGAHLKAAQPTVPPAERSRWPVLGRSVHDLDETERALRDSPDYLVAGPVFATTSKPGHPGIGLDGLREIVLAAAGCRVLAIGGLRPERVRRVLEAGAFGVAVRSGISAAADPGAAVRGYLEPLPVETGQS